ncbi:gamma-glutamyl-gamma-aminobutyrate hydrolase family protein [Octadecabacter sp. 1_MG-2023]|uniref:gamma-glutamyl-gamma-aminobutyrate hydrolase family protein n=1 Tax=unclassified Octadecabacter TaxID=196158 RepID=UPI001C089B5F|nr:MULTISPECIES: gamma-glutamyl-gamma-aminobutyrate hydrolase family protein [unclassified Octadecabacter]MBU2992967.1 gamma-glutamyl-gamma-aminobutyrate hydrolase family protein [Octadecabacter sp. B2R22]MDO6733581.1 gamma-glutamyl-gamma-aminobutyrate hydrolase family protein [Octadecabacter sp. 1_MG-2023]
MRKPVVGIIGNFYMIGDDYPSHSTGVMNSEAVAHVCGAMPLIVPSDPSLVNVDDLMEVCDGFLFTGARPNVHPEEYGHAPTEAHGDFDRERDGLALPLVRKCVQRGQPILGVCRGFQEIAVAMGCTLHPEIRDIEGRDNHRMPPDGTLDEKFALRHVVSLKEDGVFHQVMGSTEVMTNSLHGQGIMETSDKIVIDGYAPDGTPEAIYVRDAPGFTLSVQWHPEYQACDDPVSRPLFEAFGEAVRSWANREAQPLRKTA